MVLINSATCIFACAELNYVGDSSLQQLLHRPITFLLEAVLQRQGATRVFYYILALLMCVCVCVRVRVHVGGFFYSKNLMIRASSFVAHMDGNTNGAFFSTSLFRISFVTEIHYSRKNLVFGI
jgi:hypothetical protein